MSARFLKAHRLLKRREFQIMRNFQRRYVGRAVIIEIKDNRIPLTRLGITVSRKFGKAHDRNRFKRLVREAFRLNAQRLPSGVDIHIRPGSNAARAQRNCVELDIRAAFCLEPV